MKDRLQTGIKIFTTHILTKKTKQNKKYTGEEKGEVLSKGYKVC